MFACLRRRLRRECWRRHLEDGAGRSLLRTTVIERPNAVGVIAYDDRRDVVVLIEQFRAGPYVEAGVRTMLEIVAGYGDPGESERDGTAPAPGRNQPGDR